MKFKQLLKRINGLSLWGVQWVPTALEEDVANRVIAFLEPKRVLFDPFEMEIPRGCMASVEEIKQFLAEAAGDLPSNGHFRNAIRSMQAECNQFLNLMQELERKAKGLDWGAGHFANYVFHSGLGKLRGVFGIYVWMIAAKFKLDVGDDLASILPAAPTT